MPRTPSRSEHRRRHTLAATLGILAVTLVPANRVAADGSEPGSPEPKPEPSVSVPEATASAPEPGTPAPIHGHWRAAPIHGADVRSLAIHPDDPDLMLAGTSAGQLYVSRDGGGRWSEAGPRAALAGWVISDLRFDPDHPGRLWTALWGVWGGGVVLVSDDLGASWQPRAEGLPGGQVYTLALAGGGRLYAGTRSGVYGSVDDGESWRELTAAIPEIAKVTSLMLDPFRPGSVTAGTWRRAYRSDDAGATWHGVFEGMALDSEVFTLTPVPGRLDEVWASTCGWVYRSLDGGTSWRRFQQADADDRRTPSFAALPSGRLLAGTVGGLYLSDDGGATWSHSGRELTVLDLAWHPERPRRVVIGTEGSGVWISDDEGDTLRRAATGMTNVRVAALARAGSELLAAVNHAGPLSGVHASRDGGDGFAPPAQRLPPVLSLTVAGPKVLAATERGLWERSGAEWRPVTELGEHRIERVVAHGARAVAHTSGGPWESAGAGARFYPLTSTHGDEAGAADGQARAGAASGADGGTTVLPTGDRRWPLLKVGAEGAWLAAAAGSDGARGDGLRRPVELPVPAGTVTAALIADGRLWLGSSGWGLWVAPLAPAAAPAPSAAPTPQRSSADSTASSTSSSAASSDG